MSTLLTFDDVLIQDQFLEYEISRADVDLSFQGTRFPIISANMDTITSPNLAKAMLKYGAQACLHRFGTIDQNIEDFSYVDLHADSDNVPMVSIGLGAKELERAEALHDVGAARFVIDVAHGGQMSVVKQAKALRALVGFSPEIIVGNFGNPQTIETLLHHVGQGIVNAVKIGIGPGSICKTRGQTGVGYPQFSAIQGAAQLLKNTGIYIIADGGMKQAGDFAKAFGAGAHMCMTGGMLSGTDETPGDIFYNHLGKLIALDPSNPYMEDPNNWAPCKVPPKVKKYRGSASKESYEAQGKTGKHRTAEGESIYVAYRGPLEGVLQDIEGGLRSSLTYSNSRNMDEFRRKVRFNHVSSNTVIENGIRGKAV